MQNHNKICKRQVCCPCHHRGERERQRWEAMGGIAGGRHGLLCDLIIITVVEFTASCTK